MSVASRHFSGFGTVTLTDATLPVNGRAKAIFHVESTDPRALDIVGKEAQGLYPVTGLIKNHRNNTVELTIATKAPLSTTNPVIVTLFEVLGTKINGPSRTRFRFGSGMRIV